MKEIGNMKKALALTALALVAAASSASLTGCKKKAAKSEEAATTENTKEADTRYAVYTVRAAAGMLDDYLEFGGDVVSASIVNVFPDASGKISRKMVNVGDYVKKGDVVAYVDPSTPGMYYVNSPVRAPASGTVSQFPYNVGAHVNTSTSLGQISSINDLEVHINVAERFVSRVKVDQSAVITFDAYPGEQFEAKVFEVSPVLDTSTRTLKVKMRLTTPDERIRAGMYARVHLITQELNDVIVLPKTVPVVRDNKNYVFIVQGSGESATVRRQEIEPGIRVDDLMEIKSGVNIGDEIVERGQTMLTDGAKINVLATR